MTRSPVEASTPESRYLLGLAQAVAAAYRQHTAPTGILLTGSVAEGLSDRDSDLDLIAYYDDLPSPTQLSAVREAIRDALSDMVIRRTYHHDMVEEYTLRGVECQIGITSVAGWEADLAVVLDDHTPGTLTEKAIIGLLAGRALYGEDLIDRWKSRAVRYPDGLAPASVSHHLRGIVPLWLSPRRWAPRDATIFWHQALADSAVHLLGALAGTNCRYYSTFQFKRLHRFCDELTTAPVRLADRLDGVFSLDAG